MSDPTLPAPSDPWSETSETERLPAPPHRPLFPDDPRPSSPPAPAPTSGSPAPVSPPGPPAPVPPSGSPAPATSGPPAATSGPPYPTSPPPASTADPAYPAAPYPAPPGSAGAPVTPAPSFTPGAAGVPTSPAAVPPTMPMSPAAPTPLPSTALPPTMPMAPGSPGPLPPAGPAPASGTLLPATGPVVARVGEIELTSTSIRTPAGEHPLRGSTWQVSDFWQTEQRTPRWAIVMAVAGFFVVTVFSLLFLLAKKTVRRGTVQVTVTSGSWQYVARIPVTEQSEVQQIHQQVNYARSLAAL